MKGSATKGGKRYAGGTPPDYTPNRAYQDGDGHIRRERKPLDIVAIHQADHMMTGGSFYTARA